MKYLILVLIFSCAKPLFASGTKLIKKVTDGKALGYANNDNFVIDEKGQALIALRTKDKNNHFNIELLKSAGAWQTSTRWNSLFMTNQNSVDIQEAPQRAPALALGLNETVDLAWYGANTNSDSDPGVARQLRTAHVKTSNANLSQFSLQEPISILGFENAYESPYVDSQFWQEHPALAMSSVGTLYLAWEARDASQGHAKKPSPQIALIERGANGRWSKSGSTITPPYIFPKKNISSSQSRPSIVIDKKNGLHITAYGAVNKKQQLLYSQRSQGTFSAWQAISPNASMDQRHGSIAIDKDDRLHVVWREGNSNSQIRLRYSMKNSNGTWSKAITLSRKGFNASTPTLATSGNKVFAAWIEWPPGEINSEGQKDNKFPSDSSTVEGVLVKSFAAINDGAWSKPVVAAREKVSYPQLAATASGAALIYTSGATCAGVDCVQLFIESF
jgi:hypothetical protein